jgi:type II secretory pathway component GspD/PulD (secretin)
LTVPSTVLEIKRLESEKPVYSIELRNVEFGDLFRVIAHDYNLNILVDEAVEGKITASFTNISLEEALDGIAEIGNLLLEKKKNIIRVSPHLLTKSFVLHYIEAKKLLETQGSTSSAQASTTTQSAASTTTGAQSQSSSSATTKTNSIHDLLSSKGKILLGKQPNSITVIDSPPYVAKIENYLNAIDKRMTSQVFKLKYLKAQDVAGESSSSATGTTGSSTSSSTSLSTGTGG